MPPQSHSQTKPASPDDARAYLAKAREYLRAAEDSFALMHYVAAAGNAVLTAIAASDAIAVTRSGRVWKGDHGQAAGYLESVAGSEGTQAARQLRHVIPLKNPD